MTETMPSPTGRGFGESPTIGVVVGLEAEAKIARRWGHQVAIGGGGAQGAAHAANTLAPHVTALLSFGLAGGLDPSLPPGTILIPTQVTDGPESWQTDPALNQALGGPTPHTLLGGGAILATTASKQAAFAAGAHAVDLESAAVARAAARHGVPFAVLRAICDPAGRPLPQAALVALDAKGRIAPLRVALTALRHLHQLPDLLVLAKDAATARRALMDCVAATSRSLSCWQTAGVRTLDAGKTDAPHIDIR